MPAYSTRHTTLLNEVQKADPQYQYEANNPVEYEFSNGKVRRGHYKTRGAYADD